MNEKERQLEDPCRVTGMGCAWVKVNYPGPTPDKLGEHVYCGKCYRQRDWEKLERDVTTLKDMKYGDPLCLGDCMGCDGICTLKLYHAGDCFCGKPGHAWEASDFPPRLPDPLPREIKVTSMASSARSVQYKSAVFCEHANENPNQACRCHWDCACRESMCPSIDPLYEVDESKVCGEETPEGPCKDFKGHQYAKKSTRPNWHQTWMEIAHTVGLRSYDTRLKVGAIIVAEDNTTMLSLGYNGNGAGLPNVPESNEPGQSGFIHAEVNALIKCPYHYPVAKVMYVTDSPCKQCAKCVINAKVKTVVYDREYRDLSGVELLRSAGITVIKLSDLLQQK